MASNKWFADLHDIALPRRPTMISPGTPGTVGTDDNEGQKTATLDQDNSVPILSGRLGTPGTEPAIVPTVPAGENPSGTDDVDDRAAEFSHFNAGVPAVPAVPAQNAVEPHAPAQMEEGRSGYDEESGLPIAWIEGYRRLTVMRRPRAIPATTWTWLTAAAGELLTRWGTQLAAHGWSTIEVFGVHYETAQPRMADGGLLAYLVEHRKLEAIGPRSAALRLPDGTGLRINRPLATAAGMVPAWELVTGSPPRSDAGDSIP